MKSQNKSSISKSNRSTQVQKNRETPTKNVISSSSSLENYYQKEIVFPNKTFINQEKTKSSDFKLLQFGYDYLSLFSENKSILNHRNYNNYILDTGDELKLTIKYINDSKQLDLPIDENGKIFIKEFGLINVGGAPLNKIKSKLLSLYSKRYNNVSIDLELSLFRSFNIHLLGEINHSGIYNVSQDTSILKILSLAGGVKKTGSLRDIYVIRNNKTIMHFDAYDFFMKPRSLSKNLVFNFKENDILFVPSIQNTVAISGAVNRSGIFEFVENLNMYDLVNDLADGFSPDADYQSINIQRIQDGKHINLSLDKVDYKIIKNLKSISIKNGDIVTISSINDILYNSVSIMGEIPNSGTYSLDKGMTVIDLVKKSGDLTSKSYTQQINLYRMINNTQKLFILNLDNEKDKSFALQQWDVIEILNNELFTSSDVISIDGAVMITGNSVLYKNLTISEFIKKSIPKPEADLSNISLTRSYKNGETRLFRLNALESDATFSLEANDHINVPYVNGFHKPAFIKFTGNVNAPGNYAIQKDETLYDFLSRSDGLKENAFLEGIIIYRKKLEEPSNNVYYKIIEEEKKHLYLLKPPPEKIDNFGDYIAKNIAFLNMITIKQKGRVSLDTFSTLDQLKNSKSNIILEDGDSIIIPSIPQSIQVAGGVNSPGHFVFSENKSPKYYIDQAGDFTLFAFKRKVYVFKANGSVILNPSKIERGDAIFIYERVKLFPKPLDFVSQITQVLANVLIVVKAAGILE